MPGIVGPTPTTIGHLVSTLSSLMALFSSMAERGQLSDTERAVLQVLRAGAKKADEVAKALPKVQRSEVNEALRRLRANGFVAQTLEYRFEAAKAGRA